MKFLHAAFCTALLVVINTRRTCGKHLESCQMTIARQSLTKLSILLLSVKVKTFYAPLFFCCRTRRCAINIVHVARVFHNCKNTDRIKPLDYSFFLIISKTCSLYVLCSLAHCRVTDLTISTPRTHKKKKGQSTLCIIYLLTSIALKSSWALNQQNC